MAEDLIKLNQGPRELMVPENQRVVCAACMWPDDVIVLGIRHFSPDMRLTMSRMNLDAMSHIDQGFVDQWGNWLSRKEAYDIAVRQGQYNPYEPYTPGILYSEDLY